MTGIGIVEAVSGRRPEGATSNRAFNWLLLAKFFLGWVATLVVAALTSAAFTAQVRLGGGRCHWQGQRHWLQGAGPAGLPACVPPLRGGTPLRDGTPLRMRGGASPSPSWKASPSCCPAVSPPHPTPCRACTPPSRLTPTTAWPTPRPSTPPPVSLCPCRAAGPAGPGAGGIAGRQTGSACRSSAAARSCCPASRPSRPAPLPADAIANFMAQYARATGNTTLERAASAMAAACNNVTVPKPPVSFNPITSCSNIVMTTLNATTFGTY